MLDEAQFMAARRALCERTVDGKALSAGELARMVEVDFDRSGLGIFVEGGEMSRVKISVQVKRGQAFVRKVVRDDQGRVVAKYGLLNTTGEWWQVPEGERYPDECLLPVKFWAWLVPAGQEIKRALQEWLWDRRDALRWWRQRCAWYKKHWPFVLRAWVRRQR